MNTFTVFHYILMRILLLEEHFECSTFTETEYSYTLVLLLLLKNKTWVLLLLLKYKTWVLLLLLKYKIWLLVLLLKYKVWVLLLLFKYRIWVLLHPLVTYNNMNVPLMNQNDPFSMFPSLSQWRQSSDSCSLPAGQSVNRDLHHHQLLFTTTAFICFTGDKVGAIK